MNKATFNLLFRLLVAAASLAVSASAQAGLEEGIAAYKNKQFKRAVDELVPPAENGDPVALFYIAMMFEDAQGLPENFPQAMLLYQRAADSGYAPAQNNLGVMYETKAGAERNYANAKNWYLKAAAQGNAPAQYNLGLMYYIGRGNDAPRNFKTAASWYQKAADQGYAPAQNSLARMYENGLGVFVSQPQACMWYSLAIEGGYEDARANLQALKEKMYPEAVEEGAALLREWRARRAAPASASVPAAPAP